MANDLENLILTYVQSKDNPRPIAYGQYQFAYGKIWKGKVVIAYPSEDGSAIMATHNASPDEVHSMQQVIKQASAQMTVVPPISMQEPGQAGPGGEEPPMGSGGNPSGGGGGPMTDMGPEGEGGAPGGGPEGGQDGGEVPIEGPEGEGGEPAPGEEGEEGAEGEAPAEGEEEPAPEGEEKPKLPRPAKPSRPIESILSDLDEIIVESELETLLEHEEWNRINGFEGFVAKWEWDDYFDWSDLWKNMGLTEEEIAAENRKPHEALICTVKREHDGETASLCGIVDPDDKYAREIERDLAEQLHVEPGNEGDFDTMSDWEGESTLPELTKLIAESGQAKYYGVSSGDGNNGVSQSHPDYLVKTDDPWRLAKLAALSDFKPEYKDWALDNMDTDGEEDYTIYVTFQESPEAQEDRKARQDGYEKARQKYDDELDAFNNGEVMFEPDEFDQEDPSESEEYSDSAWLIYEVFPWTDPIHPRVQVYEDLESVFSEEDLKLVPGEDLKHADEGDFDTMSDWQGESTVSELDKLIEEKDDDEEEEDDKETDKSKKKKHPTGCRCGSCPGAYTISHPLGCYCNDCKKPDDADDDEESSEAGEAAEESVLDELIDVLEESQLAEAQSLRLDCHLNFEIKTESFSNESERVVLTLLPRIHGDPGYEVFDYEIFKHSPMPTVETIEKACRVAIKEWSEFAYYKEFQLKEIARKVALYIHSAKTASHQIEESLTEAMGNLIEE